MLLLEVFCVWHTAPSRAGCALDVLWRRRYPVTTNTFKSLWPPLSQPGGGLEREGAPREVGFRDFAITQAHFACKSVRKWQLEMRTGRKGWQNYVNWRTAKWCGEALRKGGEENYFQKASWRKEITFFWSNVLCALGIIMQITANINTEVMLGRFKNKGSYTVNAFMCKKMDLFPFTSAKDWKRLSGVPRPALLLTQAHVLGSICSSHFTH